MSDPVELTPEQGELLLRLARQHLVKQLEDDQTAVAGTGVQDPALQQQCGTFVTLTKHGKLRGCIGNLEPAGSMVESIIRNASNAAFHDHRFKPLQRAELADVVIDISILSPPQRLEYRDADELIRLLRPAVDGVILQVGRRRATFLPHVWHQLPEPQQFLARLCEKAGLPAEAWRTEQPEIFCYQVRSFQEGV